MAENTNAYDELKKLINDVVSTGTVSKSSGSSSSDGGGQSAGTTATTKSAGTSDYFASRRKALGLDRIKVDSDYISSFLDDSQRYMRNATADKVRMGVTSSKSIYESRKKASDDLHKRSFEISRYLDDHKDEIDEDAFKSMKDYLDAFDRSSSQSIYSFYKNKEFFSQFKNQEEYDQYVTQKEAYEAKVNLDLDNAAKEIKDLEVKRDQYYWNTDYDATSHKERVAFEKSLEDMDREIAEKKQFMNQARHIQEGVKLSGVSKNDDFRDISKYSSTYNDSAWSKLTSDYGMGYKDLTYEYINNKDGIRDEIKQKYQSFSADSVFSDGESKFEENGYDYLKDNEIAIYNYYYAKEGKEKAEEYLDSIQETLNYRKATSMYQGMEDNTALEMAFGVAAGLDQFKEGVWNLFNTEDDYIAQTAYQMASGMVREDLADNGAKLPDWMGGASLGQVGYDVITTSANMAPSILSSMAIGILNPVAGQVVGSGLMGMSAAGGAYQEALNEGYDKDQAKAYGLLVGASEIVMEKVLGGITALGGNVLGKSLTSNLTNADTALKMIAKKLGASMLSEFSEEYLQEVLTPVFKNMTLGTNEDVKLFSAEALYAGILGALTAGIMEGPTTISGELGVYRTGKQLQAADISAQRIADIGKTFSADTVAHELAGKVDENTTAYALGRLFNEIGATMTEQNVNEITNALVAKGMNEKVARSNAQALAYVVEGGQLSDAQVAIIESNDVLAEVARTTLVDENTTWNQRSQSYNEVLKSLAQEKASRTDPAQAGQENTPASDKVDTKKEEGSEADPEAETAAPKAQSIATIEDGKVTVKLEDGTEVNVKESGIDPDEGVRIETIASIDGISTTDANFILNTLRVSSDTSAQKAALGAKEAYKYGFYGFSMDHIAKHGVFINSLTETQRNAIYETGKAARAKQTEVQQATASKKAAVGDKNAATGKVHFEGNRDSLTERQSTSLKAMERIADALGVQIYVFESEVDEKGNRIGANGWYDPTDSSIHIDLHAGATGEGTMLFTLAHELTHHIHKWSPAKFKILADFLMQEYGKKGVNVDALVRAQIDKAYRTRKEKISYEKAYEEVVADSLEQMLSDGNVLNRLEKLKAKDESLWKEIKRFINDMAAKIRAVYKGLSPDSPEGRYVAEMGDAIYRLQEMFTEALADASENYQSSLMTKEETTETAPVEDTVQYSYRSLAEAAGFMAVENEDGSRYFTRDGKKVTKVTVDDIENSPIGAMINFSLDEKDISKADADKQKKMFAEICTMACKTNDFAMTMQFIGSAVFTGMKANADKQYGTTYDFPSICTKTQAVIDAMSKRMVKLGRGLNSDELVKLYQDVFASGNPVPCPECYVFSRWIGIGGLLDNIKKYQDFYGNMSVEDAAKEYRAMREKVAAFAKEQGISFGKAKGSMSSKFTKEYNKLTEKIEKAQNQGEKVKPADLKRLEELEPMMNTVKGMTWLENVYFADSSLKKVNPRFRVPDSVLFDLNNGEAFATKYKEAWAFRTTQGAGYGKAITPYAEARLGEGILVTNNTTNTIKSKAQGSLDNYFLRQKGTLDKNAKDALKRARQKQKIQAFIGGQRFQSTSDARYENASDYLLAALEMQAMGGMVQVYTKVDGAVPAFSAWGFSINQSLMPLGGGLDADGNVRDTSVGGMNPKIAFRNREKHETAGTITIGVNDNHIRTMFKQWVRDFIIPYHASGGKADVVAAFRSIQEGQEKRGKMVRSTDYSRTQGDKVLSDDVLRWQGKTDAEIQRIHDVRAARIAILTRGKVNMDVVRSNRFLSALHDKLNGGEWDGVKLAKSKVESQIFPNEFWDQSVSYEDSGKITRDYLEYCDDLGFLHRFSGMVPRNGILVPVNGYDENGNQVQLTDLAYKYNKNGQKTNRVEEFFWKVLTDRRMYDNQGKYLAQKVVTLNDTTANTITSFAKDNYGRQYDKDLSMKTAAEISEKMYSDRDSDGNQLSKGQQEFFKDSKVRDADGNLMVMYHGTANGGAFTVFDGDKLGNSPRTTQVGQGFYFTNMKKEAESYTKNVDIYGRSSNGSNPHLHQVYLNITNPFDITTDTLDIDKVKSVYMDGTEDYFFSNWIPFYLNKKNLNGRILTKSEVQAMSIADKVSAYVDYLSIFGTKEVLSNMVRAFPSGKQSELLSSMMNRLGYDGIVEEFQPGQYQYVAFSSEQIKSVDNKNPTADKDIRYSDRDYIGAVERGDMKTAQKMVDEAADAAGYKTLGYHGSWSDFTVVDGWLWTARDKETARSYTPEYNRPAPGSVPHGQDGVYSVRYRLGRNLLIDAGYNSWGELPVTEDEYPGVYADEETGDITTNAMAEWASRNGYDSISFENVYDGAAATTVDVVFNPNRDVKSADPVTYDDSGNVIPLSERFNMENDDIRYSERDFGEQVDEVLAGKFDRTNAVYVGKTPSILQRVGLNGDLPMLTTARHIRDAVKDKDTKKHHHGLTEAQVKDLPDKIADPVMVLDSKNAGSNSIVVVTDMLDPDKAPVVVTIKASGKGMYNNVEIDTNFITSYYGRDGFAKFVENNVKAGNFLYINRKKATALSTESSTQWLEQLKNYDFDTIIRTTRADVKMYSDRDTDSVSNRSLLANALESVAKNDIERRKIQEYKEKIDLINAEEKKLRELNQQIKDMTFGKGKTDIKKVRALQFDAQQAANRINTYDRQLLRLEASKPLQDVLTREKKKAFDRGVKRGKEALEAYRERAEKKQQETIERYQESRKRGIENRKKTALRQKIRKVIMDLDKILNRGDKKRNVKEGMKDFVADALASAEILFTDNYSNEDMVRNGVGTDLTPEEAKLMNEARSLMDEIAALPSGSYEAMQARMEKEQKLKGKLAHRMGKLRDVFVRERARLNKTQVSEVLGNLADSYARLETSEYSHIQGAYQEAVHEFLKMLQEDIGGTIVKDMTIGQLEELHKAYTMVMTTVRKANLMFADNLNNTREALANQVMVEVQEAGGEHGLWTKVGDKLNSFSWNNEKPVYAFERIGSKTLKTLYGNIRKGQDGWAVDIQEANDFRMEMYKKYKHNTWDPLKTYKFTSASDVDFELNLDQIMSLYAYSKRAQAHDHLLKGGFVFDGNTEVVVNKKGIKMTFLNKTATAYNLSFEILEDIISKLTPEQKAFVDEMQDYLSTTMGEKGNEVSMELYGVKLFNEQFYFPLRSAGQYMERAKEADMKQKQGQVNIANSGFSKSVKIKASNPVVLTGFMDVWAGHVNEMSMYHSFVLPMEDFRRVYNYSSPHMEGQQSASVNGVIQNAYGAAATDYIDRLYRDLNGGAITDNTAGPINKLMNLFKKGAVFASASVTIQQPSAIARATAMVDIKHFIGPKVDAKRHKDLWDEVKKYAPVAIIKEMGFFDTNMGRSAVDYLTAEEYSGIKEKAMALVKDEGFRDEQLSKAPALADELTWCVIWEAVKRETKAKHPGMNVKSEEFLKLAGDRYSEVIDKTQVYDSVLARSANMRSKDTGMKMATAFMAEPTTSINMVADALRKGKKGSKKQAARIIGSVVSSVILNSFLVSWVYAARDDDEDETYREKYISSFLSGIIDGVNPMTYIPFLKDIVSIMQGYDIERSDMAVISDLWSAWKQLKNDDVSAWRKVEGFVGSICQIFGLPVKNIMRDVRSVFQAYDTIVHGEKNTTRGTAIAIVEGITGQKPSNSEQLYNARTRGDKEHAARVAGRYADEKSANAAVRKAITDRYMDDELTLAQSTMQLSQYAGMKPDEAYWLMDGWKYKKENGSDDGYSKYSAFYEAVQTGKNLKAVIKTYTDNGVKMSSLSSQITSHFKDEYVQMSVAERAGIKGYLLNAYEQCGVSRETAEKKLADWDFEAKHGSSYDEIVADYKEGSVSEDTMRSILADKGYSKSDIEDKISDWNVYKIYGYEYSKLDDAYRAGELSREEFRQAMIDNGTFPAKADQAIITYDWMRDNAQYGLEYSDAGKYAHPIENYGYSLSDVGLDPEIYLEYKELKKGCKGVDADNDGTADSGTLRAAKFEMIDSLPITNDQKDALAAIDYSMKSVRRYAPWH